MITKAATVGIYVSDRDRTLDFYTNALGFEKRADEPMGEGARWIEVAPEGSSTSLTLVTWFEAMPPGSLQGLVVATDDIQATYDELFEKGVAFGSPPTEQPGGKQAVFRGPDGNGLVLWGRR